MQRSRISRLAGVCFKIPRTVIILRIGSTSSIGYVTMMKLRKSGINGEPHSHSRYTPEFQCH